MEPLGASYGYKAFGGSHPALAIQGVRRISPALRECKKTDLTLPFS